MATTVRGTAILKWGTYAVTGYLVNEANITNSGGETFIDNEDGQNVTQITNYDIKHQGTVLFIPLSGTSIPAIDSTLTYNGVTFVVTHIEEIHAKRQVLTWRLTLSTFS